MESGYCQIVNKAIKGKNSHQTETHAAIEILSERLERLQKNNPKFRLVEFSPTVKQLRKKSEIVAV